MPDYLVALWEGPQLLLAKDKDVDGQDWYISSKFAIYTILHVVPANGQSEIEVTSDFRTDSCL